MVRVILFLSLLKLCSGATTTATCASVAYEGSTYTVTCDVAGAVTDGISWFRANGDTTVTCNNAGSCTSSISGYSVTTSTSTQQILEIASPSVASDNGDVTCQDGFNDFTPCSLTVAPAMSSTLVQNDLQSLTSQTISGSTTLTLTVVGSCTIPVGTCTWSYQNTELPSDTGSVDSSLVSTVGQNMYSGQSCSGSYVYTICKLDITSTPSYLANRKVTLSLSIAHVSLSSPITASSNAVLTFSSSSNGLRLSSEMAVVLWFAVGSLLQVL